MLSGMKERRVPVAKLLEGRIGLIERCQLLNFRRIKGFAKADLDSHIQAIKDSGIINLPLRIRLDLFQRQVDDTIHSLMEAESNGEDFSTVVRKFKWWSQAEDALDEADLTLQHVMSEECSAIIRMPFDSREEKTEQLNQASTFDKSFFQLHFESVCKVYNKTLNWNYQSQSNDDLTFELQFSRFVNSVLNIETVFFPGGVPITYGKLVRFVAIVMTM